MGIEIEGAEFIIQSLQRKKPINGITLGRQNLFFSSKAIKILLEKYGFHFEVSNKSDISNYYSEELFRHIGVFEIDSMDFSSYENAKIVHDLNYPIPENFKSNYELVFDGGTLEHVFNFPIALKNAIDLLKIGGTFISFTPSNNYCGHGFYQFSPELFYRVFQPDYGMEIIRIQLFDVQSKVLYNIIDPEKIQERVEFQTLNPVLIFVEAKKIGEFKYSQFPQQSDYLTSWENNKKLKLKNDESQFIPKSFKKTNLYQAFKILKRLFLKEYKLQQTKYFNKTSY